MLVNSESSNARKFWKSLTTSKDDKRKSLASSSTRQNLKSMISQPTTASAITNSTTTINSQQKRQPFLESKRSSIRRSLHLSKHMSKFELSFDEIKTTDPKELEFYQTLLNSSSSFNKRSSNAEIIDMDVDDGNAKKFISDLESDKDLSSANTDELSLSIEENLQTALADYELYNKPFMTPATTSFDSKDNDATPIANNTSRSGSIPSLASLMTSTTTDSELSVLNIKNSLWVGFQECDTQKESITEFDTSEIFDDFSPKVLKHMRSNTNCNRTSLIFS